MGRTATARFIAVPRPSSLRCAPCVRYCMSPALHPPATIYVWMLFIDTYFNLGIPCPRTVGVTFHLMSPFSTLASQAPYWFLLHLEAVMLSSAVQAALPWQRTPEHY